MRIRPQELQALVFLSVGISVLAMLGQCLDDPIGMIVFALLVLFIAYYRLGRPISVPTSVGVLLVFLSIGGLVVAIAKFQIPPGLALAYFLTTLMLAKSFSLRTLSDYGGMMLLSVLAMLAAGAYRSEPLGFLVFLFLYLFVAGLCLYKGHLIAEIVTHRQLLGRGGHGHVVGSGPRTWLWAFLATGAVTCSLAVLIFILIPRQPALWLAYTSWPERQTTESGFSQSIELGEMTRLLLDRTPVMRVKILEGYQAHISSQLYLRGAVMMSYGYSSRRWRWNYQPTGSDETKLNTSNLDGPGLLQPGRGDPAMQVLWHLFHDRDVTNTLFVIDRPIAVATNQPARLVYDRATNRLRASQLLKKGFSYRILAERAADRSNLSNAASTTNRLTQTIERWLRGGRQRIVRDELPGPFNRQARKIIAVPPEELSSIELARKIESHLRMNFRYDLDNTDVDPTLEPVMDFLVRRRKGHCEYFASAMVLLCQSLGLPARLITGYKGGEFNGFGNYYLIRNCDAHAWVEVYALDRGWVRFDPTPPAREQLIQAQESETFKLFWDALDLMRFSWGEHVADLETDKQGSLIAGIRKRLMKTNDGPGGTSVLKRVANFVFNLFSPEQYESSWHQLLHWIVAVLGVMFMVLTTWIASVILRKAIRSTYGYIRGYWQARFGRRGTCPVGFYRRALHLLAGKGICRPRTRTAMEFARDLQAKHERICPEMETLTAAYLQVRFGDRPLDIGQHDKIKQALDRLQTKLADGSPNRG